MVRRLRLISGLILFCYVLTHLLNLVLGLVSFDALEAGRAVFIAFWRSWPLTGLLYGALLVHLVLALYAIFARERWAMPTVEALRYLLGVLIVPLAMLHVLGTRFAHEIYGVADSYLYIVTVQWAFDITTAIQQTSLVLVVWLHGCIGLHLWLRLKGWYGAVAAPGLAFAVLIPTLALGGYLVSGRDVLRLAQDSDWLSAVMQEANALSREQIAEVLGLRDLLVIGFFVLLLATVLLRLAWRFWKQRRGMARLTYPGNRQVAVAKGTTVLEASRIGGIAHASVCGGRGRCSTCRVRVGRGGVALPPPDADERRVLARVGAAPNVRLACQTAVFADCEVIPLLPAAAGPRQARPRPGYLQGDEREIAILFADLRGFTTLSEDRLPYDVVFVLNRYFTAMGTAVEEAGGRIDKFIGDGVMALFGIERGVVIGSRNALEAARRMAQHLDELNESLASDLAQPLRIGIGLHSGSVIVGEMGYGRATSVTAIGDAVNTASRLEALTKDFNAQLIVSAPLAGHAGVDLSAFASHQIDVRGRSAPLDIHVLDDARALPTGAVPVEAIQAKASQAEKI
ncbi:adenylate/guanylate cyclase domain-containing protein [Pelagibius litoralis]|uniref:Adenylate/guanylate cyclase domain-containing protein n=1 Tax=Pelagibius litoralis TaxID=374515 RepID=A0A967F1U5_9PROT|nr:adenylate/guanylate cyclase domain-containing protein [Pelagibius litoralis]NIA71525.1 adenylate/guanylate cyclase domain-containing protein [Pelagibius litoralis]